MLVFTRTYIRMYKGKTTKFFLSVMNLSLTEINVLVRYSKVKLTIMAWHGVFSGQYLLSPSMHKLWREG